MHFEIQKIRNIEFGNVGRGGGGGESGLLLNFILLYPWYKIHMASDFLVLVIYHCNIYSLILFLFGKY